MRRSMRLNNISVESMAFKCLLPPSTFSGIDSVAPIQPFIKLVCDQGASRDTPNENKKKRGTARAHLHIFAQGMQISNSWQVT